VIQAWWKLMRDASEIALSAPWVVQQRSARWVSGRGLHSAKNRREAQRMVSEKWAAGLEGQAALWQTTWQLQQNMLSDFWAVALGQRSARGMNRRLAKQSTQATLRGTQRSIAAVRRRVRANTQRLRSAK
jgi:hypothetical protein